MGNVRLIGSILFALSFLTLISCGEDSDPAVSAAPLPQTEDCAPPEQLRFEVLATVPRSARGLTEGLIVVNGALYESTGRISGHGPSVLNRIHPATGEVTRLASTPGGDFGEGLVKFGDSYIQLTYKEDRIYRYQSDGTPAGTRLTATYDNPMKQGWGLTTDGSALLATDGSEFLYTLDPATLEIRSRIKVEDHEGDSIRGLNELEFVNGEIYANIFPTETMIRFNAQTGCQTAEIDLGPLQEPFRCPSSLLECDSESVANGIAFEPATGLFYVTGKSWPVIYQGRFLPAE